MTYPYSPNEILLMDGASTPPADLIIGPGTAYTMAGTPATATVLGATAPTIASGAYTSCSIATFAAAGNIALYLDGVAATSSVQGAATREASLAATSYIGVLSTGNVPLTGSQLTAIWSRVLSSAEISALSSITAWSTLTTPVATGGRRRRSKAILGG